MAQSFFPALEAELSYHRDGELNLVTVTFMIEGIGVIVIAMALALDLLARRTA